MDNDSDSGFEENSSKGSRGSGRTPDIFNPNNKAGTYS